MRARLGIGLATVVLVIVGAAVSAGACVVGTGSGASCTDAALNDCLPGGTHFDGLVTFNCGGPKTIDISPGAGGTGTKAISADTTIDGGGLVTISGGGPVFVNGGITFVVRNLTIANGSALDGGGIYNLGTLTVTNSTFDHNSVANDGGGIYNNGTLTVTNSTFDHNSAGSGGGIYIFNATLELTNTIIANSTAGGDCLAVQSTVTDGGHNLIEDTGANACNLTNGTNGNIIGQDPNLDPNGLQNNGGPTQTVAVLAGSAAINAGDDAVCAADPVNGLDQRGYARPGGGLPNCTIGAYEYLALPPRYQGPALSPVALLGLGLLLVGAGAVSAQRRARR
jgi:hypothetical protein